MYTIFHRLYYNTMTVICDNPVKTSNKRNTSEAFIDNGSGDGAGVDHAEVDDTDDILNENKKRKSNACSK